MNEKGHAQAADSHLIDADRKDYARDLVYRWVVLYNPFYFMSALSLLWGILLITEGLEGSPVDWTLGNMVLVGVVHGYELCLILTAAWLNRKRGLTRPAVILGLLECLFLLDPTSFTHIVAHFEPHDVWVAVLWAILAPLKIYGLCWALGLRIRTWTLSVVLICLGMIPIAPTAFDNGWADPDRVLVLCSWGFGLLLLLLQERPLAITSKTALDEWGQTVLARVRIALAWALPIGFGMHAWAWKSIFAVDLGIHHAIPILLSLIWISKGLPVFWPIAGVALAMACPDHLMVTSFALGLVCLYQARNQRNAIYPFAAVLFIYLGVACWGWSGQELPSPSWPADMLMISSTLWLAWRHWQKLFLIPPAWRLWVRLSHQDLDPLHLGIGLAVFSFVTLIVGTWIGAKVAQGPSLSARGPSGKSMEMPRHLGEEMPGTSVKKCPAPR